MRSVFNKITVSFLKLKQLRTLTVGAMLVALYVLASFFLQFYPSESVKISIGFLFIAAAGYLLGPVMGMMVGGLGDVVTWLLKPPGPFNPGITLCMALMGLVFGLFYFKEKPTFLRCTIACVTETVIIELGLKTWFLSLLMGTGFGATLLLRLLPSGIMLIIMIPLTLLFFKAIAPIKHRLERQ